MIIVKVVHNIYFYSYSYKKTVFVVFSAAIYSARESVVYFHLFVLVKATLNTTGSQNQKLPGSAFSNILKSKF